MPVEPSEKMTRPLGRIQRSRYVAICQIFDHKMGIPTKPDACTDWKPDSVPRRSRTPFRREAGHFQRRPCGSWIMISEPGFEVQGFVCKSNRRRRRTGGASRERARPRQRRSEGAACGRHGHGAVVWFCGRLAPSTVSSMRSRRVSPLSSIR
jgi:hypothetical protein